jgi:branched-chain amino acid transport system ATP-binding protein
MTDPCAGGPAPALEVRGVRKSFGGLAALDGVSFAVAKGSIHGLIGPNGAGKTTLFNVLTGHCQADGGLFLVGGRPLRPKKIHEAVEAGVARTFQNIRLFNAMTVLENVMVGLHSRSKGGILAAILRGRSFKAEERRKKERSMERQGFVGLSARADERSDSLAYGRPRLLEIARALASDPKVLALDEPAAGMNPQEKASLRDLICAIREGGRSVLLIEHDVRLVMGVCERISVLAQGRVIFDGLPEGAREDPGVIEAYLGRPAQRGGPGPKAPAPGGITA